MEVIAPKVKLSPEIATVAGGTVPPTERPCSFEKAAAMVII